MPKVPEGVVSLQGDLPCPCEGRADVPHPKGEVPVNQRQCTRGGMEELGKVWEMLYTYFNYPEKYIAKGLEPIVKFKRNKVFKHSVMR